MMFIVLADRVSYQSRGSDTRDGEARIHAMDGAAR